MVQKFLFNLEFFKKSWVVTGILGIMVLFSLYITSFYSYIFFHSIAEMFAIVIGVGVFMVAWNSREYMKNNYFLFIGVSLLFVSGIDLVHTLSYKGMGIFQEFDANLPTQLWIAARYLQAGSFLIAPLFLTRKLRPNLVFSIYLLITCFTLVSIFYWKVFPDSFIEGEGLTEFKKISEYIISFIFLLTAIFLYKKRTYFDKNVLILLIISIIITIAAELSFTTYLSVYGFSNMFGHLMKITAFFLLYKAVIETGLTKPYNLLFLESKLRQKTLEIERNKLQKYLDVSGVVFVAIDKDQKVIMINRKGCEVLERHEKEIIGKNWFNKFIPTKERRKVRSAFIKLVRGEINPVKYFENHILTKKGKTRLIAWHNTVLYTDRGEFISTLSSGEDVTEKRKSEEKLRVSEEKFRSVMQLANDAVISADHKGKIVAWNKGAETIFGYSEDEVLGKFLTMLMPGEYKMRHKKGMERAQLQGSRISGRTIELKGIRKDKSEFPLELSLSSWEMGKKIYYTGIIRDITERKDLENRRNQFISMASHELKTPLTTIKGFTQILQKYLSVTKDKKASYFAANINSQIDKVTKLVNDMLDVSKIEAEKLVLRKEEFELDDLVQKIITDFQYVSGSHGLVREGSVKKRVCADKDRIEQVLINLISNAVKYSPRGEKIIVSTGVKDGAVMVSVRDFGMGIPQSKKNLVFDKFYRVDEKSNGASGFGLGLYISKEIIERHKGRIWVESSEGKGSTFYFTIPLKNDN